MKNILLSLTVFASLMFDVQASTKVIYGDDNRMEYFQASAQLQLLADSTLSMIKKSQLIKDANLNTILQTNQTLVNMMRVCPDEKFARQPLAPICSGFLVGEDILVTAGHCYEQGWQASPAMVCEDFSWVQGYKVEANGSVNNKIAQNRIYNCAKVIHSQLTNDGLDFAVIKLDRKVEGVKPLNIRKDGKVPSNANLVVIGHPSGLPLKITNNGQILDNQDHYTFATNLDTFQGNSGSVVIDLNSGLVEGILVRGKTDYIPSTIQVSGKTYSCNRVNYCSADGKTCKSNDPTDQLKGEEVTRITQVLPYIN
jgi:V8-like Glu-specific endopeptidase